MAEKEDYAELLERYRSRLEEKLEGKIQQYAPTTKDYQEFRKEMLPPHLTRYEQLCQLSEKLIRLKPDAKKAQQMQKAIETAHLGITPSGAVSFGVLLPLFIALAGGLLTFVFLNSPMFATVMVILGLVLIRPLINLPMYFASNWRLRASNQMVLCIFYVVTYMRHTSNIEKAIEFAAEHMSPPLSLDMKKILWDVETERYESVRESLDAYLQGWREFNMEFVESFNLITSSLLEGEEDRRLATLDKALDVILEETYEKMLHYAHNLKSPVTLLNMLGIILPILGLVILPLVVSFMEGVSWLHLFFLYNILLPVGVFLLGKAILSKRPTGYGDTDISEEIPQYRKFRNILIKIGKTELQLSPLYIASLVAGILFFIGIAPLLLHLINPAFELPADPEANFHLLEYQQDKEGRIVGPFGLGASVLSLAITLSAGLGLGLYFRLRSQNVIKIRNKTKQLEDEFASALFQMGNRLGDDIPAEMAFGKVAQGMQDSASGKFFQMVSVNIQKLGLSVEQAIFHPQYGALQYFPSKIIESSMKVLIQSVKKGPRVAAQALTNIARYIKEIHRVNERLKDLMADIISSMTSQIKFLTPAIAGIVVGITSMITTILSKLSTQLKNLNTGEAGDLGTAGITDIFGLGIPTFYFQLVVGLYVVQIIYILTILANGIENGSDKLNERYQLGVNLIRSTLMYVLIAGAVMILFNVIASQIVAKTV
ncbi:hypothetical protein J4419_05895 [Candidatus Woesearchaeota archaeon]|nr:hypothetical protein [Candidatus Woesearchaeota archaeon]